MAVAYQSSATVPMGNYTGVTDITFSKPSGLAAGDLLLCHLCIENGLTITPPTGFTQIRSTTNGMVLKGYWKIADSGDASATEFRFEITGGSGLGAGILYRITGHSPTTPIGAETGGTANNTATPSLSGFTPPANCMLFMAWEALNTSGTSSGYAIATSDPGWTERLDTVDAGGPTQFAAAQSNVRSQSTATGNFSMVDDSGDTSNSRAGHLVAIQPPVASSGFFRAALM